ncbi:hypothetical protein, partial [Campylobacter lari]
MKKKSNYTIETIQLKEIHFEKINIFEAKNNKFNTNANIENTVAKINDKNYYLQINVQHTTRDENNHDISISRISLEAKFSIEVGYEKEYKSIIVSALEKLYTKAIEMLNSIYNKAYIP